MYIHVHVYMCTVKHLSMISYEAHNNTLIHILLHKPMSLLRLKSTRLSSAQASRWTVRRRSNEIASVQEVISGGAAAVQLQAELSILTDDDRRELLKPPITEISPEDSLAMKAGALLPWKKIRIMRR